MDARALWPDPGQTIEWWGELAGKFGAGPAYPLLRPFLLGIRGVAPYAPETHGLVSVPSYNDTFVLFSANGMLPPQVFPGSTHAFQKTSGASPDVNHDGSGDVATIDPGRYVMRLAPGKYPVFRISNADGSVELACHRDLDHDGIPEAAGYRADSILFHVGYDAPADSDHKSSIGCQTASLRWLRALAYAVLGHDAIDYVLTTAEDVLEIAKPMHASVEPERLA